MTTDEAIERYEKEGWKHCKCACSASVGAIAEVDRLRNVIESLLVTAVEGVEFMTRMEMARSIQKEALSALSGKA